MPSNEGVSNRADRPSLDVILQEMQELRRFQNSSVEALDAKAGTLVGFLGVIMTLSAGKLYFDYPLSSLLSALCMLSLIGSLINAVRGLQVRGYHFNPSPDALVDDYLFRHPDEWRGDKAGAKEQILADQRDAYNQNKVMLDKKTACVQWTINLLLAGVLFFIGQYFYPKIAAFSCQLCRLLNP
ncbi:MAG: hypothetical protein HYZ91_06100 [Candidatus Omnitrophica bacterium]|nr:hypothetical protein [Candidatus Omnitrophota bacterium]